MGLHEIHDIQYQSCQHLRITRKNTIFEVAEWHDARIYKNYGFLMLKNLRFYYMYINQTLDEHALD